VVRVLNESSREDYQHLLSSGLYRRLVDRGLLLPHEEVCREGWEPIDSWRVIRPERIAFISYPFEWCFSQLKDAALATLEIQREALRCGMMLKDAAAPNVQFRDGRPVLIDTTSLVRVQSGIWPAYYQFCKHFVAPLLLAAYRGSASLRLSAVEADGLPLEFVSALLPRRSWLRPLALWHLHIHSRANAHTLRAPASIDSGVSRQTVLADSLYCGLENLRLGRAASPWVHYQDERPTYSSGAWEAKITAVRRVLAQLKPSVVWDLGMATGFFTREAVSTGAFAVGFDADAACVETAYLEARNRGETRLLPLVQDLLRPTGPGGWAASEILGLSERGPADLLLVLGLTHHLAVMGGVPLDLQLKEFARLGRAALVELIPASDPIVEEWGTRFHVRNLSVEAFEASIGPHFSVLEKIPLPASTRVLYLLRTN
jgi:hypothetical protein